MSAIGIHLSFTARIFLEVESETIQQGGDHSKVSAAGKRRAMRYLFLPQSTKVHQDALVNLCTLRVRCANSSPAIDGTRPSSGRTAVRPYICRRKLAPAVE